MAYLIMNRNTLEGFQTGNLLGLDALFFSGFEEQNGNTYARWVPAMANAQRFHKEQDAWDLLHEQWGEAFASEVMLVVSVHESALHRSEKIKNDIRV